MDYLREGAMVCKGILVFEDYTVKSHIHLYINVTKKMVQDIIDKFEEYLSQLSANEIVDMLISRVKELSKTEKRYHWSEDNYRKLAKKN